MELMYLLFVAALATVLASAVNLALAPIWSRMRGQGSHGAYGNAFSVQFTGLIVQLGAGILAGFLFWLSWGLAAVIGVPWWLRGASFGVAVWSAGCLPVLVGQVVLARGHWLAALATALEWLTTFLLVGLACGWSWSRGP
jgi:hypothetical protein